MIWPIMIHADKSRVGKDYAAHKIVQVLAQKGILTGHHKIAEELKRLCRKQFAGVCSEDDYENTPELRQQSIEGLSVDNVIDLWIKVGELYRTIDKNYWIRQCSASILKHIGTLQGIKVPVISDYRFDCEYDYIHNVFGGRVSTLKIKSEQGVVNASDGKVTRLADYEITNYFDRSFDRTIEVFCHEFLKNMEKGIA